MPDLSPLPPSQSLIIDGLVRDCLAPAVTELPVIVLWSARGDERNHVLEHIRQRSSGGRPCAYLDLRTADSVQPHQLIARLTVGLGEKVAGYGRLSFPRFYLGLIAIRAPVDLESRQRTHAALKTLIDNDRRLKSTTRDVLTEVVTEIAMAGVQHAPLPDVDLAAGMRGVVEVIDRSVLAIRRRTDENLRWFRDNQARQFNDLLDALVHLRVEWEDERNRDRVEAVLCDAFLADLRAAYAGGRFTPSRKDRAVVLLDHADRPAGHRFLKVLTTLRHSRLINGPAALAEVPLLVLAAAHTRFPDFALRDGESPVGSGPRHVSHSAWLKQRAAGDPTPQALLLVVEVGDLDRDDREAVVRRCSPLRLDPTEVSLAERLTNGHPWGFGYILRALAVARNEPTAVPDLRQLLQLPDPDGSGRLVADVIVDQLLANVPDDVREDIVTCSAASDVSRPARLMALGVSPTEEPAELNQFCLTDLLVNRPAGRRPEAPTFHPFLRRVLLHVLARRPAELLNGWRAVHDRLRAYRPARNETPQNLYHSLALGDLSTAVGHLESQLGVLDAAIWLRRLSAIGAAPRPRTPAGVSPRDEVRRLAAEATGDHRLAHLVAARWVSADPLGDPTGSLDTLIAADLDHLAERAGRDADLFYDEAQTYRDRRRPR